MNLSISGFARLDVPLNQLRVHFGRDATGQRNTPLNVSIGLALSGEVAAGVDMIFDGSWMGAEVSGNLDEAVRLRHDGNPSAVNYRTIWQQGNSAAPGV